MAAKLERTRTPGIFKRGSRYVFSYRVDGRQKWESARTLDQARSNRSERLTGIRRGDGHRSTARLRDYGPEWIDCYHGQIVFEGKAGCAHGCMRSSTSRLSRSRSPPTSASAIDRGFCQYVWRVRTAAPKYRSMISTFCSL